jgi:hypothetical protein
VCLLGLQNMAELGPHVGQGHCRGGGGGREQAF